MNRNVCDCNAVSAPTGERFGRWLGVILLALTFSTAACLPARAAVLIQDNFNDADRNNDGTTDDGNSSPVETPDGIKWLSVGGQTSGGVQRPGLTIVDDSVEGGIGGGNALNVQTLGANNEVMAVFGQTITLGPTIGSELRVSFDIRILDFILPNTAQSFRFGIYQDSDEQFGMASVNADLSPTVWGETDGWFDGQNPNSTVGPLGDYGVHARVKLGTSAPSVSDWRVYEEINENTILGGTGDLDVVAQPVDFEAMGAKALNSNEPRHITLTISRVAANATGNTVMHTLDVDGLSFSGHDANGTGVPNFDSRDSFDYFIALTTVSIGNYVIDNFKIESIIADPPTGLPGDYNDDGFVDAADYTVWRNNLDTNFDLNGNGDETGPSMGTVDAADYIWWKDNYGNTGPGAGGGSLGSAAVPEPGTGVLFSICVALAACGWRRRAV